MTTVNNTKPALVQETQMYGVTLSYTSGDLSLSQTSHDKDSKDIHIIQEITVNSCRSPLRGTGQS